MGIHANPQFKAVLSSPALRDSITVAMLQGYIPIPSSKL